MGASTSLTPEQLRLRGQIAASIRWSREDPAVNAARGQRGLRERFEREARAADPDASDAEIARRAACAYRAHFQRLALASSKARARKAGTGDAA